MILLKRLALLTLLTPLVVCLACWLVVVFLVEVATGQPDNEDITTTWRDL